MRYLTLPEVLELYHQIMAQSGGKEGIRDLNALESALAQPRLTFEGQELYPSLAGKAAALGYALIRNHPFLDGNKRIGHAAMEVFLVLNGFDIRADIDEQEDVVMKVASGELSREALATWLQEHLVPISR